MTKVFYEKIGRRYIPCRNFDSTLDASLKIGSHLVVVQPGIRHMRYDVDPDYAGLMVAFKLCEQECIAALLDASQAKPSISLTEKERLAVAAYYNVMGDEKTFRFEFPSIQNMLKSFEKQLIEKSIELNKQEK